ncbi:hypothetical protein [Hymenobacter psoromatis]|uniref:hypothetical protein n=1 Tax=Hymenobacter psoromatis TaxID=1484116 RepID=UPI001CBAA59F|nr:hypothetical protein [Hymenobacter psoromatis]
MIASTIGQEFLRQHNARHGQAHTPDAYFREVFVPLFFDHPNYFIPGGNSPLENPKFKKGTRPEAPERAERIGKFYHKLATDPAGSSPIGYPSSDPEANTSGQVSNLGLTVSTDEAMLSWVGGGLGVGVDGGYQLLFTNPDLLHLLEEGWQHYRHFLNTTEGIAPNQVNSWNGHWLAHALGAAYNPAQPLAGFGTDTWLASEGPTQGRVQTVAWNKLLFGLARRLGQRPLVAYVYNLGQMNTTIGFLPLLLPDVRRVVELYRRLFGELDYARDRPVLETIYGSAFGFRRACQLGSIGVQALEPKWLRGLMPYAGNGKEGKMPKLDKSDNTQVISFHAYQTWLLAMLNNDSLWEESEKVAHLLLAYEAGAGKLNTKRGNAVQAVLKATNRRRFQDAMEPVVADSNPPAEAIALCHAVHLLPEDNFQYFLTLVRLRYAEFAR